MNDFQRLLENIQWLQPYLKLSTDDLEPLNDILKGDDEAISPRQLTEKGRQIVLQVENAIQYQQMHYSNYDKPWQAYILPTRHTHTAALLQNGPLLWFHLLVSPAKVLNPYYEAVACLIQKKPDGI